MIKVKIHDLKIFENFLIIAGKFVQQGQLLITKNKSSMYCKNPKEFSTSRLLLDTNVITLDENENIDFIKICIRDITALRSSINIIQTVENINKTVLLLEEIKTVDGETFAKTIQYKGQAKFKLISVDFQVIEQYVSKELTVDLTTTWEFNIDPLRLDILQNKTGNIVNTQDDVSIYFYEDPTSKKVMIDLKSKSSPYMNNIALPISDTYIGHLPETMPEVAIHESSFRLLNILKVTDQNKLNCFFNDEYNLFFIESELNQLNYYIKSRLLISIIKGK